MDVGHRHDLRSIFGVDHRGPSRHRQGEVLNATGRHSNNAFGATDEVVVSDGALVGVKALARFQRDRMKFALGVAELDAVTDPEQLSSQGGWLLNAILRVR